MYQSIEEESTECRRGADDRRPDESIAGPHIVGGEVDESLVHDLSQEGGFLRI